MGGYIINPLLRSGLQKVIGNELKKGENSIKVDENGTTITGNVNAQDMYLGGNKVSVLQSINLLFEQLGFKMTLKGDATTELVEGLTSTADVGDVYILISEGEIGGKEYKAGDWVIRRDTGEWNLLSKSDTKIKVEDIEIKGDIEVKTDNVINVKITNTENTQFNYEFLAQ